jgi:glycosyltransferase involved in cell wall biosynthesis
MDASDQPNVVLVHDWLTGMRGGEKCLEVLCRRWPTAPLFTLLHKRGTVSDAIESRDIQTSFLGRLPRAEHYYRYLLPLMPLAAGRWRLPPCDLVVSLSHCVAKGVRAPSGVPHICYCFTPMRYIWHQQQAYFGREKAIGWKRRILDHALERLRRWDRRTETRVTHFVAISRTVQKRIRECYGRPSKVIYPPVDTEYYAPADVHREDYYLAVSAFAPYKRLDVAILACNQLKRKLVIIGSGQDEKRLRRLAGPTIHFLGWQPNALIRDHLRRGRALLFPGEEDFGIAPVEAMACGMPVVALARGGALETVMGLNHPAGSPAAPTGIFLAEPTVDCLVEAIHELERRGPEFDPVTARRQAQRFSVRRFEEEFFSYVGLILAHPGEQRKAA